MKNQINEPDFIGGQGALTKEEEMALSQYFAKKKSKLNKSTVTVQTKAKSRRKVNS